METLADWIRQRGPLAPPDAVGWAIRLAKHVESLHEHGVAHGNVSPACILMASASPRSRGLMSDVRKTTESLPYHSPERMVGGQLSPVDDAWAIAATLYTALTAAPPFVGASDDELKQQVLRGSPAPLSAYGLNDQRLDRLIGATFAADPSRRLSNVSQLRQELEHWHPQAAGLEALDDEEAGDEDHAATAMLNMMGDDDPVTSSDSKGLFAPPSYQDSRPGSQGRGPVDDPNALAAPAEQDATVMRALPAHIMAMAARAASGSNPPPADPAQAPQPSMPQMPPPQMGAPQMQQAPMGQAPMGQAPMGQAPMGQAPMGQAPMGQAPMGQAPMGQAPMGQAPMGQAPMGQAPMQGGMQRPQGYGGPPPSYPQGPGGPQSRPQVPVRNQHSDAENEGDATRIAPAPDIAAALRAAQVGGPPGAIPPPRGSQPGPGFAPPGGMAGGMPPPGGISPRGMPMPPPGMPPGMQPPGMQPPGMPGMPPPGMGGPGMPPPNAGAPAPRPGFGTPPAPGTVESVRPADPDDVRTVMHAGDEIAALLKQGPPGAKPPPARPSGPGAPARPLAPPVIPDDDEDDGARTVMRDSPMLTAELMNRPAPKPSQMEPTQGEARWQPAAPPAPLGPPGQNPLASQPAFARAPGPPSFQQQQPQQQQPQQPQMPAPGMGGGMGGGAMGGGAMGSGAMGGGFGMGGGVSALIAEALEAAPPMAEPSNSPPGGSLASSLGIGPSGGGVGPGPMLPNLGSQSLGGPNAGGLGGPNLGGQNLGGQNLGGQNLGQGSQVSPPTAAFPTPPQGFQHTPSGGLANPTGLGPGGLPELSPTGYPIGDAVSQPLPSKKKRGAGGLIVVCLLVLILAAAVTFILLKYRAKLGIPLHF